MSITNIFGIAGSALNAQITRMNATASNLANAGTVSGKEEEAFRGKRAVFKALVNEEMTNAGAPYVGGVMVSGLQDDTAAPRLRPQEPAGRQGRLCLPVQRE